MYIHTCTCSIRAVWPHIHVHVQDIHVISSVPYIHEKLCNIHCPHIWTLVHFLILYIHVHCLLTFNLWPHQAVTTLWLCLTGLRGNSTPLIREMRTLCPHILTSCQPGHCVLFRGLSGTECLVLGLIHCTHVVDERVIYNYREKSVAEKTVADSNKSLPNYKTFYAQNIVHCQLLTTYLCTTYIGGRIYTCTSTHTPRISHTNLTLGSRLFVVEWRVRHNSGHTRVSQRYTVPYIFTKVHQKRRNDCSRENSCRFFFTKTENGRGIGNAYCLWRHHKNVLSWLYSTIPLWRHRQKLCWVGSWVNHYGG